MRDAYRIPVGADAKRLPRLKCVKTVGVYPSTLITL
jgi:hypothetical protein